MATFCPPLRCDSLRFQAIRDAIDSRHFPNGIGVDTLIDEASDAYLDAFITPLGRTVCAVKCELAGTQSAAGAEIHVDRSALSDGIRHGEIGARPLAAMLLDSRVMKRVVDQHPQLVNDAGREGFVAAANLVASRMDQPTISSGALTRVTYECMCELIVDRFELGNQAGSIDNACVRRVIDRVLQDASRNLVPAWRGDRNTSPVNQLQAWLSNPESGVSYLTALESEWTGIFVYTWAIAEGLGCAFKWWNDADRTDSLRDA